MKAETQKEEVFQPDTITCVGWPSRPITFGQYDSNATTTLTIYVMYDTQRLGADKRIAPHLDAIVVDDEAYGRRSLAEAL